MPKDLNLQIDVDVLCQEIAKVKTMCDKYNIVELDEILIKKEQFNALFFPFGENFGINKKIRNYFIFFAVYMVT